MLSILALVIVILSIIEIRNDYGIKDIVPILENLVDKNKSCAQYISYIKSKSDKRMPKAKTLINLIYNLIKFIYSLFIIKNYDESCMIGIIFFIILLVGNCCNGVLTFYFLDYYPSFLDYYDIIFNDDYNCFSGNNKINKATSSIKEAKNFSKLFEKLDYVIIAFCIFSWILVFFSCPVLIEDCRSYHWIEWEFFGGMGECCENFKRKKRGNDSDILRINSSNNIIIDENINLKMIIEN